MGYYNTDDWGMLMIDYNYWLLYCKLRDFVKTSTRKTDFDKEKLLNRIKWLYKYVSLLEDKEYCHSKPLPDLVRGDVVLVELGENLGMEFSGQHPAVVLRDCLSNVDQVFCLPLTSKKPKGYNPNKPGIYLEFKRIPGMRGYRHPINIHHPNNGKHWCNILNLRNISKRRINYPPYPCKMDGHDLTAISVAIKKQVAL